MASNSERMDEVVASCPVVFAIAFLSGMAWLASPLFHPASAFSEEERIGIHLARGEGFLSPFAEGSTAPPSAWCAPIYPLIVGAVYHFMGVRTQGAVLCILLFNLTCRALAAAAVLKIGRKYFGAAAGMIAAAVFIADPMFLSAASLCWDNSLALAIFLWLLAGEISVVTLGIGGGVLLLTNAAYATALGLMIFAATLRKPWGGYPWALRPAMACSLLILTIAPWTLRNAATFHRLFFVRDNLYTELWIGNQPGGTGWMTSGMMAAHPSVDPNNRREILSLGEMGYADLCRERFWEEVGKEPGEFWWRCGSRAAYLVFGRTTWASILGLAALAGASMKNLNAKLKIRRGGTPGWKSAVAGRPERAEANSFLVSFVSSRRLGAGNSIATMGLIAAGFAYFLTQVSDRYVLPVRAGLILLAAAAVSRAMERIMHRSSRPFRSETGPAERMPRQSPGMCGGGFDSTDRFGNRSAA